MQKSNNIALKISAVLYILIGITETLFSAPIQQEKDLIKRSETIPENEHTEELLDLLYFLQKKAEDAHDYFKSLQDSYNHKPNSKLGFLMPTNAAEDPEYQNDQDRIWVFLQETDIYWRIISNTCHKLITQYQNQTDNENILTKDPLILENWQKTMKNIFHQLIRALIISFDAIINEISYLADKKIIDTKTTWGFEFLQVKMKDTNTKMHIVQAEESEITDVGKPFFKLIKRAMKEKCTLAMRKDNPKECFNFLCNEFHTLLKETSFHLDEDLLSVFQGEYINFNILVTVLKKFDVFYTKIFPIKPCLEIEDDKILIDDVRQIKTPRYIIDAIFRQYYLKILKANPKKNNLQAGKNFYIDRLSEKEIDRFVTTTLSTMNPQADIPIPYYKKRHDTNTSKNPNRKKIKNKKTLKNTHPILKTEATNIKEATIPSSSKNIHNTEATNIKEATIPSSSKNIHNTEATNIKEATIPSSSKNIHNKEATNIKEATIPSSSKNIHNKEATNIKEATIPSSSKNIHNKETQSNSSVASTKNTKNGSEKIILKNKAAEVYAIAMKLKGAENYSVRKRDFYDFLRQINKDHNKDGNEKKSRFTKGSNISFSLPNKINNNIIKGNIHLPHSGSIIMPDLDLQYFLRNALIRAGLTRDYIELEL